MRGFTFECNEQGGFAEENHEHDELLTETSELKLQIWSLERQRIRV